MEEEALLLHSDEGGDIILSELSKVVKKDFLQVSIGLIERVALRGMLLYMVGEPPRSGLSL